MVRHDWREQKSSYRGHGVKHAAGLKKVQADLAALEGKRTGGGH